MQDAQLGAASRVISCIRSTGEEQVDTKMPLVMGMTVHYLCHPREQSVFRLRANSG